MVAAGAAYRRAVSVIAYLSLGVYLFTALRALIKKAFASFRYGFTPDAASFRMRNLWCVKRRGSTLDVQASKKANHSQLTFLVSFASFLAHPCAVGVTSLAARDVFKGVWTRDERDMYFGMLDVTVLMLVVLLGVQHCPVAPSMAWVDIFYTVLMVILTFYMSVGFSSLLSQLLAQPMAVLVRFCLVALTNNTWLALALNVICSTALAFKYNRLVLQDPGDMDAMMNWLCLQEGAVTLVIVAACFGLARHRLAEARAALEVEAEKIHRSALAAILDVASHVVVELDEQLRIVGNSSSLAALLLRGPELSSSGATLQELMPQAEDRERFLNHFEKARSEQHCQAAEVLTASETQSMNVLMQDSLNQSLHMELIIVSFTRIDGSVKHLVGMREVEDSPWPVDLPANVPVHKEVCPSKYGAVAFRGTPSNLAAEDLLVSDTDSETGQSQKRDHPLLAPEHVETKTAAIHSLLLCLMMQLNLPMRPVSCCPFHETAKVCSSVLKRMKREQCHAEFSPLTSASSLPVQCSRCGVFESVLAPAHSDCYCVVCNIRGEGKDRQACKSCMSL